MGAAYRVSYLYISSRAAEVVSIRTNERVGVDWIQRNRTDGYRLRFLGLVRPSVLSYCAFAFQHSVQQTAQTSMKLTRS